MEQGISGMENYAGGEVIDEKEPNSPFSLPLLYTLLLMRKRERRASKKRKKTGKLFLYFSYK